MRLPAIGLAMIGAMIRRSDHPAVIAWKDSLECLRALDLEDIKQTFPGYPYPDLLRALEVSVETLDASNRERYLDMAVFREDQPIPETTLRVLWKLDARRTRKCMDAFADYSLATIAVEASSVGVTSMLNLHDLLRDLIRKRREKDLPDLHLRLVEAWNALPKLDFYVWRWVPYHLVQAGRGDDLRRLLLDFNYLQAKLEATDTNALIADYDYLPEDKDLQLVQSAIRLSAHILADRQQLAGQLTGRLFGYSNSKIQTFLKQAAGGKAWPWLLPLAPSLIAPSGPLIRILEGHAWEVTTVAVTPDGRHVVSGSWDHTLRVWDLATGEIKTTLRGHTSSVSAVAVTPDGRHVVSGSDDCTLRVWDLATGETKKTLQGHTGRVSAVAVMPDGRHVVSGSDDHTLRVWDMATGETKNTLQGHTFWVRAVAVTPDGRHVVSGSDDCTLRVWDLKDEKEILRFTVDGEVTACNVAQDNQTIVAGDSFGRVHFLRLVEADETKPAPGDTKIPLLHQARS